MASEQPVLFLSHGGGPSYFLSAKDMPVFKGMDKDSEAANYLRNLIKSNGLKKPEAVLILSAHWEERISTVNTASQHSLYFDYYNFPPETYKITWPVKGALDTARKVKTVLEKRGIRCEENSSRGLDHGVFVPLKLVFPEADIPVCQLSLLSSLDIRTHLDIAETLSDLRHEGVLIIGSGFATHTVGTPAASPTTWLQEFRDWLHDTLLNRQYTCETRKSKLVQCLQTAPHIRKAHPRIEHLIPLLMCCAAAGYEPGKLLYSEVVMNTLLNEHYLF